MTTRAFETAVPGFNQLNMDMLWVCGHWNHASCKVLNPHSSHFYEACPESKDTKVSNTYSLFKIQKPHFE